MAENAYNLVSVHVSLPERLRGQTRNLLRRRAQVRILWFTALFHCHICAAQIAPFALSAGACMHPQECAAIYFLSATVLCAMCAEASASASNISTHNALMRCRPQLPPLPLVAHVYYIVSYMMCTTSLGMRLQRP